MNEVALVSGDTSVDRLIAVLQAQGSSVVPPSSRSGLHLLLVPLAEGPAPSAASAASDSGNECASAGSQPVVTCLLRWPERQAVMGLPVVCMRRGERSVRLLARSASEYVHRALAEEEEKTGGRGPVAEAAGADGRALYEPGAFERSGLPTLAAYLARRVGMFPDVAEALALGHLARGDTVSALVTCEWYQRKDQLPGWGRPYEFHAQVLQRIGRPDEARDVARVALQYLPWWTFLEGYAPLRDAVGLAGGPSDVRRALSQQDQIGSVLLGSLADKTEKHLNLKEAGWVMNSAAAGEVGWDAIRSAVASKYADAGLVDVAEFVLA